MNGYVSVMAATGGCSWEWRVADRRLNLVPGGKPFFGKEIHTYDDLMALVHPDDVNRLKKGMDRFCIDNGKDAEEVEFRTQGTGGNWRWFVARKNSAEYASGKAVKVRGALLDIDAYKGLMEAMRTSERRIATIFKSAPGSMAVTDNRGKLIEANQAFYDMFGYSAEELQGTPIMSLADTRYEGDDGAVMADILMKCESHEDNHFHLEEEFVHSGGQRITLDYGLSSILDFDGNVLNYVFAGIDITMQKKRAAEFRLLAENQRWLFDFLRQFNQFDGIGQLFAALKENLPKVVSFSSLKLLAPSFLGQSWVMDSTAESGAEDTAGELAELFSGEGPSGKAYLSRVSVIENDEKRACSVLAIPLTYKEKIWGVLDLKSNALNAFTNQDVTLMSIVGGNIGLYFEEQSGRAELDLHARQLQQLHSLIHSLLSTQSRNHLLEGVLGYLKSVIANSACSIYLFSDELEGNEKLKRLAGYDEGNLSVSDSGSVLEAINRGAPFVERNENDLETRRILPLVFQTRTIGAVDLYKPSGMLPAELKLYQLLADYVSGFWMLYDLMAVREEEAFIDALTGIWNRRYMIRRLQEENDRITRYGGNACLAIGDMGNFKYVNDNYGHTKGDEVLAKAADAIKRKLRLSDSVGRYGGDEFILLLPNVSEIDANIIIGRIKEELEQIEIRSDDANSKSPPVSVVIDFGLAFFPGGASSLLDTINLADEAMYANKLARKEKLGIKDQRR